MVTERLLIGDCLIGCEAAVHAVCQLFYDLESQAVLLVDASNAFNSVNQQAALHNILHICPSLVQILINTYQHPVCLIIPGSGVHQRHHTGGSFGHGHVCLGCYSTYPSFAFQ